MSSNAVCTACVIIHITPSVDPSALAALRTEGDAAAERWVRALKAGGSLPPVDLMRVTGIEMTDLEPLRSAARLFGRLVTELEQSME